MLSLVLIAQIVLISPVSRNPYFCTILMLNDHEKIVVVKELSLSAVAFCSVECCAAVARSSASLQHTPTRRKPTRPIGVIRRGEIH